MSVLDVFSSNAVVFCLVLLDCVPVIMVSMPSHPSPPGLCACDTCGAHVISLNGTCVVTFAAFWTALEKEIGGAERQLVRLREEYGSFSGALQ